MASINRTLFYNVVRANPFGGVLTQQNVDGCNAILDEWDRAHAAEDINKLGYILATVFGETGTMRWDVREGVPKGETRQSYFTRMYDIRGARPKKALELGNDQPGDGAKYYGRGPSQCTGKRNYRLFGSRLGIDLVANPDAALEKTVAIRILFDGMFHGLFTGRKLGDYFDGLPHDEAEMKRRRIHARAIINGTDKAEKFARLAAAFTMGLRTATVGRTALFDAADVLAPLLPPKRLPGLFGMPVAPPLRPQLDTPDLPDALQDLAPAAISAAVREATGGKITLPIDKGKPLLQSLTVNGALLAGVPGILGAITSIQDRVVAILVVLVIVAGVGLVVTGRVRIKQEAGV
jgi:putative chitinase